MRALGAWVVVFGKPVEVGGEKEEGEGRKKGLVSVRFFFSPVV